MNAEQVNRQRFAEAREASAIAALKHAGANGVLPNLPGSGVTVQTALRLLISLMDSIPDRIYFKDLESRFILVNKAMATSCGAADSAALSGKTDFDFFTEEHARDAMADEKRVIATGQPVISKEEKETWLGGGINWCSTTKMPLHDEAGRIVGTFGISRDVTERHLAQDELRASEERYRQLLSAVPTYTYSVQFEDGKPVRTNHGTGCLAVTGYARGEFEADPFLWINMVHPEDRTAVLNHIDQILAGARITPIEHRIVDKGGATRWIRNTIVQHCDRSGKVASYDGLVEDITGRKAAELELQKTLGELEKRVLQRTAALTQTNLALQDELAERQRADERLRVAMERLDALDKAKMRFVFNVSHELKLPVVSLRYALENMLKGVTGVMSEKQTEYVSLMHHSVERLVRTLQEILDVGRIEANAMVLKRSEVVAADFVRQVVKRLDIIAGRKSVALSVDPGEAAATVSWDLDKMERVLLNVVENAIKFTQAGGVVEVALRMDPGQPDVLILTVTDNGVGIPREHIDHIMERYYRADESIPGVGLGLSICREIVRLHGGDVTLASPPPGREKGTMVTLRLPQVAFRTVVPAFRDTP